MLVSAFRSRHCKGRGNIHLTMSKKRKRELGQDRPITRRDFIHGSTAMLGAALASSSCDAPAPEESGESGATDYAFDVGEAWYGPGGVGDYASSHGNTPELLRVAHQVRKGAFDQRTVNVVETGESYDLVVGGGGIAGLSAAHHFRRLQPGGRALILDNHPIFGGEAKRNEILVDGHRIVGPQGSDDFGVPPQTGDPDDYFTSLGIPRAFDYKKPTGAAEGLKIPFDHFSYMHWKQSAFATGHFFDDTPREPNALFPDLPTTPSHLLRVAGKKGWAMDPWNEDLDSDVVRQWRAASAEGHRGDRELGPWLDGMTVKTYYEQVLGLPSSITAYVDPILASIIGLGCDAISAWWGWHFELPGFRQADRYRDLTFHSFPGGNTGFARYFVKSLNPDALAGSTSLSDVLLSPVRFTALDREENAVNIRLNATVVRVEHEADKTVSITYVESGKLYRVRSTSTVMASGGWVNRRVLRDLPDAHRSAYESFRHSSVLIANVALTNWRFLAKLAVAACIYEAGFGFSCNIRRPMIVGDEKGSIDPDRPIVLTFYVPYFYPGLPAKGQGEAGRLELLTASFETIEARLREQMMVLFADGGFDPTRDVAGIILNRWGHAYTNPEPGFMFGVDGAEPVPDVIRKPFGRIAIGHSELGGHQNWTGAAAEGRRAVEALLDG